MANQPALEWQESIPCSTQFEDSYYSRQNGLAETRHVFLDGNALPRRFESADKLMIAELGFGTGLNFLAAWQLWQTVSSNNARLYFTSFERFPMTKNDMAQAISVWPELTLLLERLLSQYTPDGGRYVFDNVELSLIIGDANQTLSDWRGKADAWFLDGFNPKTNPELWNAGLIQQVAAHTVKGGTFATYTAAGHVRRALQTNGFQVEKCNGYGHKREMSRGCLLEKREDPSN